jgi:benzil reductase ((S)-benzoin forming)
VAVQSARGDPAAIVTGVSRGLGAALAGNLLGRGFIVLGVGRTANRGLERDRYRFAQIDLADSAAIDSILAPAFADLRLVRPASVCLVNNAATVDSIGMLGRLAASEIASALATNLTATVALANLFCRVFADSELPRRVINVSSGAADTALQGEAVYCVAKAGVEMLTRTLAAEQQAPAFRAITLRPGVMDTDMQTFARSQPPDVLPVIDLFKSPAELTAARIRKPQRFVTTFPHHFTPERACCRLSAGRRSSDAVKRMRESQHQRGGLVGGIGARLPIDGALRVAARCGSARDEWSYRYTRRRQDESAALHRISVATSGSCESVAVAGAGRAGFLRAGSAESGGGLRAVCAPISIVARGVRARFACGGGRSRRRARPLGA